MFDPGSDRPPIWRNFTAIAVGVVMALVLAFGLGLVVGRAPRNATPALSETANQAVATILPVPPPAQTPPPTATEPPAAPTPPPPAIVPQSAAPKPVPAKPPVAAAIAPSPPAPEIHQKRPKPPEPEAPPQKPAVHEPPAPAGNWIIQVGAFRSSEHASLLVQGLATHGRRAVERQFTDPHGVLWYIVELQGFATRAAAETAADTLKSAEHLPVLIRREP